MRAIHVSDLHLRTDRKHNEVARFKLSEVEGMMGTDDVLVVTGDLTDDGKAEQYAHARELLMRFKGRIVVVPGNHDYGPLGNFYDTECVKRFARLKADLGCSTPFMLRQNGKTVGEIIVMDSNLRTTSPTDFAQGRVGMIQRWRLAAKLRTMKKYGAVSVVALHHSPLCTDWFLRMLDAKAFLDTVLGNANTVLVGHEHKKRIVNFPMNLPVDLAQTMIYSAGSLNAEGTEILVIPLTKEG